MNALKHNESDIENEADKVSNENDSDFNEMDKEIKSDNINRKSILEKWGDKLKEFLDNA